MEELMQLVIEIATERTGSHPGLPAIVALPLLSALLTGVVVGVVVISNGL